MFQVHIHQVWGCCWSYNGGYCSTMWTCGWLIISSACLELTWLALVKFFFLLYVGLFNRIIKSYALIASTQLDRTFCKVTIRIKHLISNSCKSTWMLLYRRVCRSCPLGLHKFVAMRAWFFCFLSFLIPLFFLSSPSSAGSVDGNTSCVPLSEQLKQ